MAYNPVRNPWRIATSVALLICILCILAGIASAQITSQVIISQSNQGLGDQTSHCPSFSGDARYTLFESYASNLVTGDTNNRSDIFLYDSQNPSLRLLSKSSQGTIQQGGENPTTCSSNISRDGSTVVYATDGIGLVDSVQTNVSRLYAIDVANSTVELLTTGELDEGVFFPSVSSDGSRVVFVSNDTHLSSEANGLFQVYLLQRPGNTITMLSVDQSGNAGNGQSIRAEISHDGKWVAFVSQSTNLKGASSAETSETYQVYLLNIETGEHTLVTRSALGDVGNGDSLGAHLSADGGQVIFFTTANNLTPLDANKNGDVLLYERSSGQFELISVNTDGKRIKGFHELLGNAISADGNLIMFRALQGSFDKFKIEVYVRDRKNSQTYLSSFSNSCSFGAQGGDSHSGSIAPDAPVLGFAIGKDTRRSALQLTQIGLDVLQTISQAPSALDTPDADVCGSTVTLAMTPFSITSTSAERAAARRANPGVSYETKITKAGAAVKRVTGKRNIITVSKLPPGSYSASYRVNVNSGSSTTRSDYSTPTKFRVK